jgi:hypothetical protein
MSPSPFWLHSGCPYKASITSGQTTSENLMPRSRDRSRRMSALTYWLIALIFLAAAWAMLPVRHEQGRASAIEQA